MAGVRQAVSAMQSANVDLGKAVAEAVAVSARNQQAADAMSQLNNQMVTRLDTVSAVVEETTAATEEMAGGASAVAQAIENIANVGEENSAAVEEVSASAEEMSAQIEEVTAAAHSLAGMARDLQAAVAQFKLGDERLARAAPGASAPAKLTGSSVGRSAGLALLSGGNGHRLWDRQSQAGGARADEEVRS